MPHTERTLRSRRNSHPVVVNSVATRHLAITSRGTVVGIGNRYGAWEVPHFSTFTPSFGASCYRTVKGRPDASIMDVLTIGEVSAILSA